MAMTPQIMACEVLSSPCIDNRFLKRFVATDWQTGLSTLGPLIHS